MHFCGYLGPGKVKQQIDKRIFRAYNNRNSIGKEVLPLSITEKAKQSILSGITPIRLGWYKVCPCDDGGAALLRSVLILENLELGVLTPAQYRFVARRTKQGDALVERHLEMLLSTWRWERRDVEAVTVPVYPRVLLSGKLAYLLFEGFARHPEAAASRLCIECSSDILFEDFELVQQQWQALRKMGVKLAISEVGEDFCPLTRLAALRPDYVFADAAKLSLLEQEGSSLEQLCQYLHLSNARVYLPPLADPGQKHSGKSAGFDGWVEQEVAL